jgi:murein DD-endopeptidase MepM/ murein hydrolase activator NlpD
VKISSGYGERAAPCNGCSSMHMGLDFQPPNDSPVYAIADGTVAFQEDDTYGYGNHVIINHGDLLGNGQSIQTLYAHMQHGSVPVRAGDVIHVGDFLGLVGRTGTATGIHLHFEVHLDGVQVDPFKWLKANAN